MTVNSQYFAMQMAGRWKIDMGKVVSPELMLVWQQQAETFNAKITGAYPRQWIVLQPPTGSGKSRGLETYCSLLDQENHPGVLIVVRMIEDADSMVEEINRLSESEVAIARHSENDTELDDLSAFPVVVITHSAYQTAVQVQNIWNGMTSWNGGKRKLVVIDESLNVLEQTQVDYDQLKAASGEMPYHIREKFPNEARMLDHVISKMLGFAKTSTGKNKVITPEKWDLHEFMDLSGLKRDAGAIPYDETILNKTDETERQNIAGRYRKIFNDTEKIVQSDCVYAQKGNFHLFSKARVTVPRHMMDAVVLDATASCNPIYELLGDAVRLIDPPKNVRSYKNVVLHVSYGHKVGKVSMTKDAEKDASAFMGGLKGILSEGQKVFICTHKDIEAHILGYDLHHRACHWGAIDGKNDWNDCEVAVMYGLQYLDQIVPETTLRAIEDWREFPFPHDQRNRIIHQLEVGHQIVSLVQSMNRVRCRNVTDDKGNCDSTDIFILLPDKTRTAEILEGIVSEMPGIVIKPWKANAPKRKVRRSSYEAPLLAYLAALNRGKHLANDVREFLKIPDTSFERLLKTARDTGSNLYQALMGIGVSYHMHGEGQGGRGHHSWFEKF